MAEQGDDDTSDPEADSGADAARHGAGGVDLDEVDGFPRRPNTGAEGDGGNTSAQFRSWYYQIKRQFSYRLRQPRRALVLWVRKLVGSGDGPRTPQRRRARLVPFLSRFALPLAVTLIGVALVAFDRPVDAHLEIFRLGVILIMIGLLWSVALGFSLTTLRLATAIVIVVIVFALTGVGSGARLRSEAQEARSLQSELEIEVNVLEGARTSRGEVIGSLENSAEAVQTAAIQCRAGQVARDRIQDWRVHFTAADVDLDPGAADNLQAFEEALVSSMDSIETGMVVTRQAIDGGWASLGLDRDRYLEAIAGERGVESLKLEEVAGAEARARQREARSTTFDLDAEVSHIESLVVELTNWSGSAPSVPGLDGGESEPASPTATSDGADSGEDTPSEGEDAAERDGAGSDESGGALPSLADLACIAGGADNGVGEQQAAGGTAVAPKTDVTASAEAPEHRDPVLALDAATLSDLIGKLTLPQPVNDRITKCAEPELGSEPANLVAAASQADPCLRGCFTSEEPECEPRMAKRFILIGFRVQLETLTERESVNDARTELLARLATVREQLTSLDNPVAMHQLAMDGADELIGDALHGSRMLGGDTPAGLGGWGWLAVTLAIVVGYRLLEIVNDRRSPGPVTVRAAETPDDKPSPTTLAAAELVRSHLAAVDLQEPSPVPGGEAVSSISSSAEAFGADNTVIRFLVSLAQTTLFPRRGVDVIVTTQDSNLGVGDGGKSGSDEASPSALYGPEDGYTEQHDADGGDAAYRLMIRAISTRRNGLIFSHPFEGRNLEEVAHAAAYYAAEHLLDAGWTTPSWLVWTSQDGTALRAYQEVMIDQQSPSQLLRPPRMDESSSGSTITRPARLEPRERVERLEKAVAASPGTGAALVALSHELSLKEDFGTAVHRLLIARTRHPGFLTARYRLGVILSMLAANDATEWCNAKKGIHRSGAVDVLNDLDPLWDNAKSASWKAVRLLTLAIDELDFVIRAATFPRTLWRARLQDEREYWLGLARSSRSRRALRAAAVSARALAEVRYHQLHKALAKEREARILLTRRSPANAEQQALQDNAWAVRLAPDDWIVRYNAACFEAAHGYYGSSLDHLRRARHARNGQQLYVRWVHVDPELSLLRESLGDKWEHWLRDLFEVEVETLRRDLGPADDDSANRSNPDAGPVPPGD